MLGSYILGRHSGFLGRRLCYLHLLVYLCTAIRAKSRRGFNSNTTVATPVFEVLATVTAEMLPHGNLGTTFWTRECLLQFVLRFIFLKYILSYVTELSKFCHAVVLMSLWFIVPKCSLKTVRMHHVCLTILCKNKDTSDEPIRNDTL